MIFSQDIRNHNPRPNICKFQNLGCNFNRTFFATHFRVEPWSEQLRHLFISACLPRKIWTIPKMQSFPLVFKFLVRTFNVTSKTHSLMKKEDFHLVFIVCSLLNFWLIPSYRNTYLIIINWRFYPHCICRISTKPFTLKSQTSPIQWGQSGPYYGCTTGNIFNIGLQTYTIFTSYQNNSTIN